MLQKQIKTLSESHEFTRTEPGLRILSFVTKLNQFASRFSSSAHISNSFLSKATELFSLVEASIAPYLSSTAPIVNYRYGNPLFTTWCASVFKSVKEFHLENLSLSEPELAELSEYFLDGFGDRTRLDYGTGHELSFVIWLLALTSLPGCGAGLSSDPAHFADFLNLFAVYLRFARVVQTEFHLEPAGSKGVWGLDDFQFLPIVFGTAQLQDYAVYGDVTPRNFVDLEPKVYARENFLFSALCFIRKSKSGTLRENSPRIFAFREEACWETLNEKLLKGFKNEVLGSFPVAQHIKFGDIIRYEED